jgi:hypothetical protein
MMLAGIAVRDDLILELARLVELSDRLEDCYGRAVKSYSASGRC